MCLKHYIRKFRHVHSFWKLALFLTLSVLLGYRSLILSIVIIKNRSPPVSGVNPPGHRQTPDWG